MFGISVAIQVENTLRDIYNGGVLGGFMSFIDALAGGEMDPYKLLEAFGNGAKEGVKSAALTAGLTSIRNLGCLAPRLSMLSSLTMVTLAGISTTEAFAGAIEALAEGNYEQALLRLIGATASAYGTYKAAGAAYATISGVTNGTSCFVAGTLVLTEDGHKPVEEIKVGDYVYASDPETGENGYKEVLQTFVNESSELVHIHVNGEEIVSTSTHPFYSPQRGWTSAVDLRAGDILVLSNGEFVVVEQVQHEILEAPVKVYNFEVQDFHTYYVGKNSVLVHNMCPTEEIYSFGNSEKPRGARPRQDFGVESFDDIVGPEIADPANGIFPKGASNITNPNNSSLKGHYYSIPQGTELPSGLDIIADGSDLYRNSPHGEGHYTVFPTREMTVSEFNDLYKSLPWIHRGKK